jgi:thiol-disulfide isomerase/thioredoxin
LVLFLQRKAVFKNLNDHMKRIKFLLLVIGVATFAFGFIYQSNPQGTNVGDKAIDLAFTSPEGKTIALSSLKGKVVLLDFWASWCGPCRMENPNLVAAYAKYKDAKFKNAKGFAIYSVSMDQNKEAWIKAIKQDNLSWPYHVSDLGGWQSKPAQIYRVNSIPASYLLDQNGVIIGKNLRGAALDQALEKLLK